MYVLSGKCLWETRAHLGMREQLGGLLLPWTPLKYVLNARFTLQHQTYPPA